jgi:hypothetical protein
MTDDLSGDLRCADFKEAPRMYAPEIQPAMQALLATLAQIDFEYERDSEKLTRSSVPAVVKDQVKAKLADRQRREPYVRQLTALQDRIRSEYYSHSTGTGQHV